jgi:hypothetical protein
LESAHNDVGEGECIGNSFFEVCRRGVIFARLDRSYLEVGESAIDIELVELFLCLDGLEGGEDEVDDFVVADVVRWVALDFIGNVGGELREEGGFGDFAKSNEPRAGQGVILSHGTIQAGSG